MRKIPLAFFLVFFLPLLLAAQGGNSSCAGTWVDSLNSINGKGRLEASVQLSAKRITVSTYTVDLLRSAAAMSWNVFPCKIVDSILPPKQKDVCIYIVRLDSTGAYTAIPLYRDPRGLRVNVQYLDYLDSTMSIATCKSQTARGVREYFEDELNVETAALFAKNANLFRPCETVRESRQWPAADLKSDAQLANYLKGVSDYIGKKGNTYNQQSFSKLDEVVEDYFFSRKIRIAQGSNLISAASASGNEQVKAGMKTLLEAWNKKLAELGNKH